MALGIALAAFSMLSAPAAADQLVDVAYEEMASQQNEAAIRRIEDNDALAQDDPARLINLGVAYAREGRTEEARELLNAAARHQTRYWLETANGDWVDSRNLAYRALAALDGGKISNTTRMASR
ncbi:MAG: hypothetical protein WAT93_04125 [Pontixanthobacter sp.]